MQLCCVWSATGIWSRHMLIDAHDRRSGQGCDCGEHCPRPAPKAEPFSWSAVAPALACAVCPACLATYGKVLSALGVGVGVTERQHEVLLVVAVALSLAVSAWRTWRTRRPWPVTVATLGAGLVLSGHWADIHAIEWAGIVVLVVGGITEQVKLRRRRSSKLAAPELAAIH
jgi:hypothetical protein